VRYAAIAVGLISLLSRCTIEGDLGAGAPLPGCPALCNGRCVELASDRDNCGRCGVACESDEVCRAVVCRYPWPASWASVYQERFQREDTPGWIIFGGACAPQGPSVAPDGMPAWDLRPDWAHLRRVDPLTTDGDRAWIWRMWIDPPTDRVWGASGCARTQVTEAYGPRNSAVCFDFASNSGDGVNWYADGSRRLRWRAPRVGSSFGWRSRRPTGVRGSGWTAPRCGRGVFATTTGQTATGGR
jgi:hypothetical protein